MKTIWIVYPYGGIIGEKFLEARHIRFGRMLAENGYRVIFWTANFSHTFKTVRSRGWKKIKVADNFYIQLVPSVPYEKNISIGRVRFEMKFSRSLAHAWKKSRQPDLILTAGTGLVTAFYPVWPYVRDKDIPVIYDIMDIHLFNSYMEQHHRLLSPAAKLLTHNIEKREKPFFKNVSAVCGLGKNQIEIAKQLVKKEKQKDVPSCLVYNGIDVKAFRNNMDKPVTLPLPAKDEGWTWCVYAGSLGPSYDIPTILNCADRIHENGEKIRFIIAGAGPQAELVREASARNDRIIYLGALDPSDLPALYSRCDIGMCTYAAYSTVDMPDKFYDYTSAGLAVINSLQGEIRDYVVENQVGLQYQAEDPGSLYDNILKVRGSIETYQQNAYDIAERFDINIMLKSLLEMINGLMCARD